jgi:hypothetical protein
MDFAFERMFELYFRDLETDESRTCYVIRRAQYKMKM